MRMGQQNQEYPALAARHWGRETILGPHRLSPIQLAHYVVHKLGRLLCPCGGRAAESALNSAAGKFARATMAALHNAVLRHGMCAWLKPPAKMQHMMLLTRGAMAALNSSSCPEPWNTPLKE